MICGSRSDVDMEEEPGPAGCFDLMLEPMVRSLCPFLQTLSVTAFMCRSDHPVRLSGRIRQELSRPHAAQVSICSTSRSKQNNIHPRPPVCPSTRDQYYAVRLRRANNHHQSSRPHHRLHREEAWAQTQVQAARRSGAARPRSAHGLLARAPSSSTTRRHPPLLPMTSRRAKSSEGAVLPVIIMHALTLLCL